MPGTPLSKLVVPNEDVGSRDDTEEEDTRPLLEADQHVPAEDE